MTDTGKINLLTYFNDGNLGGNFDKYANEYIADLIREDIKKENNIMAYQKLSTNYYYCKCLECGHEIRISCDDLSKDFKYCINCGVKIIEHLEPKWSKQGEIFYKPKLDVLSLEVGMNKKDTTMLGGNDCGRNED